MDECIFCKIVKGDIPSSKVFENEDVLVLLDIAPINKGHCLVIPKEHYRNLLDTPDHIVSEMMKVVKKLSHAVKDAIGASGINIQISNEEAAGQVVFHHHIHIIPRFEDDGLKHWPGGKYSEGEMEEYRKKLEGYL